MIVDQATTVVERSRVSITCWNASPATPAGIEASTTPTPSRRSAGWPARTPRVR